jgi:RNA polymerase sigma-70 factor (ECF subfamily)
MLRRPNDVEDVAQEVFLKAYRSLRTFDQRAAFSTWLYTITANECRDNWRKQKIRPLIYEADISAEQISRHDGIAFGTRPDDDPIKLMEAREKLDRLLAPLSNQDRLLLILREIEGFSIPELAEIFGFNPNTLKVRLFRARLRVKTFDGARAASHQRGESGLFG